MRALTSCTTLFTLVLSLAACGDDKGTTTDTTQTPATDSTGTATDPTGSTTGVSDSTSDAPTTTTDTSVTSTTDPTGTTTDPTGTTTDATGTTTDPTGTTTTTDTTTDTDTTGDTTTDGASDPNWPAPDAMNPMMMPCPEGFAAASFSMGGIVCAPKCGVNDMCPDPATGTVQGECLFNPNSSGAACMMGDMCAGEEEECVMTGGGGMACLAPSSHCVLLCGGGATCPDGMECYDDLICQYPV